MTTVTRTVIIFPSSGQTDLNPNHTKVPAFSCTSCTIHWLQQKITDSHKRTDAKHPTLTGPVFETPRRRRVRWRRRSRTRRRRASPAASTSASHRVPSACSTEACRRRWKRENIVSQHKETPPELVRVSYCTTSVIHSFCVFCSI